MTVSDTALSAAKQVCCDLQCHWHSEQFRHQERFIKASEKRGTA